MDEMNTVVDGVPMDSVQDDAAQDQQGNELSEIVEQQQAPEKEPGGLRGRINDAVSKAVKESEARIRAEYEQQYAPMREQLLDQQAKQLVADGAIKDLEMAREYLRMKGGSAAPAQSVKPDPQPAAEDPTISARADVLAKQAQKILSKTGVNVMDLYNGDQNIQQKINSGEWDFYDVLEEAGPSRHPPTPVRSSNGNLGAGQVSIRAMTDKQWKALNDAIDKGKAFRA